MPCVDKHRFVNESNLLIRYYTGARNGNYMGKLSNKKLLDFCKEREK